MGLLGNIAVGHKRPRSGAPFPSTAANNGLSVDPVSGRIVLGNNAGGSTAQLLSAREIPLNDFSVGFVGTAGLGLGNRVDINLQADYIFSSTNISALHRTERFLRGYIAKGSTGGTNVLSSWGRDGSNAVEVGHNMETTGTGFRLGSYISSRGAAPDLNMNAGLAGRLLFTVNDNDPTAATLAALVFANGNMRVSSNQTDNAAKFQVRGTGGNIVNFESSTGTSRFSITDAGVITLATVVTAAAAVAVVKNTGNNQLQHIVGASATVSPVTSITVLNGIVTAVS